MFDSYKFYTLEPSHTRPTTYSPPRKASSDIECTFPTASIAVLFQLEHDDE